MVIDVLGPTGEQLLVPEYHVIVYDRRHPRGRADRWAVLFFTWMDDYVPLTAAERAERLGALQPAKSLPDSGTAYPSGIPRSRRRIVSAIGGCAGWSSTSSS